MLETTFRRLLHESLLTEPSSSTPFAGFEVPNFSARFRFFSSSAASCSFCSLKDQLPLLRLSTKNKQAYGVSSTSGFGAALAAAGVAFVAVAAGATGVSFFSGIPNLAALFASTSSLIPSGALSIAPTFSFFVTGVSAADAGLLSAGLEVAGGGLVRADEAEVALGLNGIPNRSARAFIACCAGVNVCSALDDSV